jgi:hypothetical protein
LSGGKKRFTEIERKDLKKIVLTFGEIDSEREKDKKKFRLLWEIEKRIKYS